jgi:hypothetical protein
LLVVECPRRRPPPDALFLCAEVLGYEVVQVEDVAELEGEPDLHDVAAVVFASDRPAAAWPEAVRHARRLLPGRVVVVLAAPGRSADPGARRALGEALLSQDDPPERLLLALDPRLR